MTNPSEPSGKNRSAMDRREFLQCAAGGLILSALSTRTAYGSTTEELTFASEGFTFTLHIPKAGGTQLQSLSNPKTKFEWVRAGTPISPVWMAAGQSISDWTSKKGARKRAATGDRIEIGSRSKGGKISATTALQAFSGAPILEFQTEFQNPAKTSLREVTAFGPFRFALRYDIGELRVHAIRRNEYGLETIPVNGQISLSGGRWNAPEYGGLLLLEAVGKNEFLLVGIEWERGWRYRIQKDADGTWLSVDLADLTHDMAAGEKIAAPRVFLGLAHGDREQAFLTARHYMQGHVFTPSLKSWPWVVYDFWATEAEGVEEALLREVEFSAKLGVDIFVHDASWYTGSSKKGTGDWGCGLGNYTDDRLKFPSGLAAISRSVHQAGMKFGLWVGPNVVDSRLVGTKIPKQWTAQLKGKELTLHPKGWESSVHQVCLGCREYIDFLKRELTRIVREFDLNWLKWDNSGIPGSPAGCDRADHGHQAGDASYASLVGQYEIFEHLHATFPDLVLEQCGYGSRLDYGLARTIRSNWLSDASYPSEHVRHNAMLANYLYPSADNGAWIVIEDKALLESVNDPAALDTIFRSRMMSLFGFGTILGLLKERVSLFPEPVLAAARRNVPVYKRYRHLLQNDCYHLSASADEAKLQAIQFVSPSGDEAAVLLFRAGSSQSSVQLPLRGLKRNATYDLAFANGGPAQQLSGAELLSTGIVVSLAQGATSEVVLLHTRGS
jgi:alpha-galactosidase